MATIIYKIIIPLHFPVALLISVALFGILAVIVKNKRNVFQKVLFWNFLLGIAGAFAAIVTGLYEEQRIFHNEEIHALMETHKTLPNRSFKSRIMNMIINIPGQYR